MKEYSTLLGSPKPEPRHQMQFNDIPRAPLEDQVLTPLQEIQFILSPTYWAFFRMKLLTPRHHSFQFFSFSIFKTVLPTQQYALIFIQIWEEKR